GLSRFFEHGESRSFRRLAWFAVALLALFIAQRAGAGVAQVCERVLRAVALGPFDVHACSCGQVYFYRLWICRWCHFHRRGTQGSSMAALLGMTVRYSRQISNSRS